MATPLLELMDVTAGYGPVTVLDGLSLSIDQGEKLALIGRNGVGKTTTLATVMGLAQLQGGCIRFDGEDLSGLTTHQRAMRGLGLVPQTRDVFPSLTVEENLLAGLKHRSRAALSEAYDLFPRLAERRYNGGAQLSGGEQQMVAVARALLGQPRLLMLDEPLEGLAPLIRLELLRAFSRMVTERDLTLVIVEQQVREALQQTDRAVVLSRGRVVHDGPAQALQQDADALGRLVGVSHS
ncbi:MAG: ABC transporter ATP-binding protein [Burkholderiales bacterium 66-5]|jgi:branched-chain amino acid transport system ATP-binding protein|uniref:ABC transporter ATP-binding protein n=1 Tax=Comamonas badia TaxID=265291 RepID=UPI000464B09F|nr:ABC transporter ATP-binding protein [Comamonas badia]OJU86514.1 MAG: ABC transporter ATP-binding protein [Burkholderiales bacterium 66-5]